MAVAGPLLSTYVPSELWTDDPANIKVTSPQQARRVVRRRLTYRPDLIKIWFIPMPGERLAAQTAWVRAAIEESHAAGVRVAVHATQLEVARAAVSAGADILAHSVDDRPVDDAFIKLSRERKVVYVTTLIVHEGYQGVLGQTVKLTDSGAWEILRPSPPGVIWPGSQPGNVGLSGGPVASSCSRT